MSDDFLQLSYSRLTTAKTSFLCFFFKKNRYFLRSTPMKVFFFRTVLGMFLPNLGSKSLRKGGQINTRVKQQNELPQSICHLLNDSRDKSSDTKKRVFCENLENFFQKWGNLRGLDNKKGRFFEYFKKSVPKWPKKRVFFLCVFHDPTQ